MQGARDLAIRLLTYVVWLVFLGVLVHWALSPMAAVGEVITPSELQAPGQVPGLFDCPTYNKNEFRWQNTCGGPTGPNQCFSLPCVNKFCFEPRPCASGEFAWGVGKNGDAKCHPIGPTPTSTGLTPTPTITVSETPTLTPTPTVTITVTSTPLITATPTPTPTSTTLACPTGADGSGGVYSLLWFSDLGCLSTTTPVLTPTPTRSPTPTLTATPTVTISPTLTLSATPTVTPTQTTVATPTTGPVLGISGNDLAFTFQNYVELLSNSLYIKFDGADLGKPADIIHIELLPSNTPTVTPTITRTPTFTASPTVTPTKTLIGTSTPTISSTPAATPSATFTSNLVAIPVVAAESGSISQSNPTYFYVNGAATQTENQARQALQLDGKTGVATEFWCEAASSPGTGTKWTMSFRLNGADTALLCEMANAQSTCTNPLAAVPVADQDLVDFAAVPVNGVGPPTTLRCGLTLRLNVQQATPTPTITITPTLTPVPTVTATRTVTPTITATPTVSATATLRPTATLTVRPTATAVGTTGTPLPTPAIVVPLLESSGYIFSATNTQFMWGTSDTDLTSGHHVVSTSEALVQAQIALAGTTAPSPI